VVLFCVFRRTAKHEQEAGQPYCRLCNYQLTNLDAKTCPECGVELTKRNRVMGTRKRWTLAGLLATMAVVVLAYMKLADSSQRGESIQRWFNWSSTWLYGWARMENWVWLLRGTDNAHRLVRIELSQGAVVETMYEQLGRWALVRMLLSPSHNVLCGMDSWKGRVVFIDLHTGRDLFVEGNRELDDIYQISLDESTTTVYAGDQFSQIWKCDLTALNWMPVSSVYSHTIEQWGASLAEESARAVVVDRRDTTGAPLDHPTANVIDLGAGTIIATWHVEPNNWQPVTITADGQRLFCQRSDGVALMHHLPTGRTATLAQSAVTNSRDVMASPDGRWVVMRSTTGSSIQVVDCDSDTLLADLNSPGVWPNDLALDMNGLCLYECVLDSADGQFKIAKYVLRDVARNAAPVDNVTSSEP
jgi:hypothetical protein